MYKLILVDDEEEVRKGIINKLQWENYGFQLVGEAANGNEALEIVENIIPDVVITDIKMPFMDGLELSMNLKKTFSDIKIVILTGFDDFDYAHKAIKSKVNEYVLKPVSADELVGILTKLKVQLDEEYAKKADMKALKEFYIESMPIMKEKFLASLISSKLDNLEIKEKSENFNINFSGEGFVASVISIDNNLLQSDKLSQGDLFKFAVQNIVNEIVMRENQGVAFLHAEHVVIITVYEGTNKEIIVKRNFLMLEEIRKSIEKYLKFTITVGVGNTCTDISLIYYSYQNAVAALDYKVIMGNNRIILIEDMEPQSVEGIGAPEIDEYQLSSAIKVGTEKEIIKTIDTMFDDISATKISFKEYQIYILEMLTTILKTAKKSNLDLSDIFGNNFNVFVELNSFSEINEVKVWFKDKAVKIMNCISEDRKDSTLLLVDKAKEYVSKNYSDSEITIEKVCGYLHISPTYFSYIFKRETKLTFINFLTQVRMEISKELLKDSSMKSRDVAEKVGYAEPNYFSYCFKKHYGISPLQFRNSL